MFGWIPIIGPIIDGIVSTVKSFFNYKTVQYKVDGSVDIEAMKTTADIINSTKDDIGVRLARDLILFPVAIWTSLITWDNIVVYMRPDLVWTVSKYPPGMEWFPYMVLGFLFGLGALNFLKRR